MDINIVKNKILKITDKNKSRKTLLIIFVLFVVLGYLFFFSSPYLFPEKLNIEFSKLGDTQNITMDESATLVRWDYDKDKNIMEVEMCFNSESFIKDTDYDISVMYKKRGNIKRLHTKAILKKNDMYIVQLLNVPKKLDAISFSVAIPENINSSASSVKWYYKNSLAYQTDIKDAQPEKYYRLLKLNRTVEAMQQEIQSLEKRKSSQEEEIKSIKQSIDDMNKNKIYQTANEIENTNTQIQTYQHQAGELEESNVIIDKKIANDKKTILDTQIQLEKLNN